MMQPRGFLEEEDVVEVAVDEIGTIRTPVRARELSGGDSPRATPITTGRSSARAT
jgi:hypothetical protein